MTLGRSPGISSVGRYFWPPRGDQIEQPLDLEFESAALEQLAGESKFDDYRLGIRVWVEWSRDYADRLDPTENGQPLEPAEQPIQPEDLRP